MHLLKFIAQILRSKSSWINPSYRETSMSQEMDLPSPTSDIEEGKRNLDTYGFTIHKNYISPDAVKALRNRLDEQAEFEREHGVASFAFDESGVPDSFLQPHIGCPVGLPQLQRVLLLVNKGHVFIELAKNPAGLAYAEHIFQGIPFNVISQFGLILRKGCPGQSLHVDETVHFPMQAEFPISINVMVALGNYDEETGATRVVPKSHRWDKTLVWSSDDPTVPIIMEPGSAALWGSRLWHAQGHVKSDDSRYSISIAYGVDFMKQIDCFPSSIQDDVYQSMSKEELTLYGLKILTSGRISPRSSTDERANTNFRLPYVPDLRRTKMP